MNTARTILTLGLMCGLVSSAIPASDWPQYAANPQRTAASKETLTFPLKPAWTYMPSSPPSPAWPRTTFERNRMAFDHASQPVVASGVVYFGSSSDDTLRALDLTTGAIRWRFTTGGPVRFAPAVVDGRVFLASDDGYLYCLDAKSGKVEWTFRGGPNGERIIGSGRVISRWPLRCGVLVQDGIVYFAAGMWPSEGVFVYALDAKSGSVKWCNDTCGQGYLYQPHGASALTGVAAQGYLAAGTGVLLVPCGRSVPAGFDMKTGRMLYHNPTARYGGQYSGGTWTMIRGGTYYVIGTSRMKVNRVARFSLTDGKSKGSVYPYTGRYYAGVRFQESGMIQGASDKRSKGWNHAFGNLHTAARAGSDVIAGGDGKVAVLDWKTGKKKWESSVEGAVHGLAVANGKLLVSTDVGRVYCFGEAGGKIIRDAVSKSNAKPSQAAKPILSVAKERGIDRGFALVIGESDARLAEALAKATDLSVLALLSTEKSVADERARLLSSTSLYGKRITVQPLAKTEGLPFPTYAANLIVITAKPEGISGDECYRVLRPYGGVMYLTGDAKGLLQGAKIPPKELKSAASAKLVVRGPLQDVFDWNSKATSDKRVKWPLALGWYGGPGPDKMGTRQSTPVAAYGRVYMKGQEYLTAIDAYNGAELWSRKIGHFVGKFIRPIPRNDGIRLTHNAMTADDRHLYLHMREPSGKTNKTVLSVQMDARTGKVKKYFGLKRPAGPHDLKAPKTFEIKKAGASSGTITLSKTTDGLRIQLATKDPKVVSPLATPKQYRIHTHWTIGDYWDLFFDFRPAKKRFGLYGEETFHLVVAPSTKFVARVGRGDRRPDLKAKGEVTKSGSVADVVIPWKDLEKLAGHKPTSFGFGAILHATDGGKRPTLASGYFSADRNALVLNNGWATMILGPGAQNGSYPRELVADLSGLPQTASKSRTPPVIKRGRDAKGRGVFKTHADPLTGESKPVRFIRSYGCGPTVASAYMDFFRSGTLGHYDFADDSGMRNFGGMKPTCGVSTMPAMGMVFSNSSVQCICGYSYYGSVGLVPAHRRSNEDWALFPYIGPLSAPLKQLRLNLGAPGDRRDGDKQLWLGYPRSARKPHRGKVPYAYQVPVKSVAGVKAFRVNADRVKIEGSTLPWVHASFARGLKELTVSLLPKDAAASQRSFLLRLHFCELDDVKPGDRVFDVSVQGKTVLKGLDVIKEAGGRFKALVKEFKAVKAGADLKIEFLSKAEKTTSNAVPILNALEIVTEKE